jgi:hypothetical protein
MAKLSTRSKTIECNDGTTVETTLAFDRHRRIDASYETYLGLYQAITGPEERQKIFREFSPGFFDLIVDSFRSAIHRPACRTLVPSSAQWNPETPGTVSRQQLRHLPPAPGVPQHR